MVYKIVAFLISKSRIDEVKDTFASLGDEFELMVLTPVNEFPEFISENKPDIILIDNSLHNGWVKDLISQVRSNDQISDTPIIALCNYEELKPNYVNGLPLGVDDLIFSPIRSEELLLRIRQVIQRGKLIHQLKLESEQLNVISTAASKAGNSVIIISEAGEISWVNEGFQRLYECNLDDFNRKFGNNLFNPQINPITYKAINKCRNTKDCVTYDSLWETPNGKTKFIQTTLTPILDTSGDISKIVAIETDITELKIAEQELEEKNEHLLTITENLEEVNNLLDDQRKEIEKQKISLEQEKAKSDALLNNILPFEVARSLEKKGVYKPKKFREVSVLFTDFIDFSKLSVAYEEIDEFLSVLGSYFEAFDEITSQRFIEKIKTIGDSYMCVGGIPRTNHSHPFDTVLAALEIQKYVEKKAKLSKAEGEPVWRLRVGIHTGSVIAGVVGKWKFAYDIWGDTVNIASRMETAGEAGMVNISESTYQFIKDYFHCTFRGRVPAKNIGEINMYYVDRILPDYSEDDEGIVPNAKFRKILASF